MAPFADWFSENWFSLIQSIGIAAGLSFTAQTLRRDIKARRTSDQLLLLEQHRELWSEIHRRPELSRLMESGRDIAVETITAAEEQFLTVVIPHFHSGWLVVSEGETLVTLTAFSLDAGQFFRLPVPAVVWTKVRHKYEPEFRKFIDESVRKADCAAPD